jgi:hypothetical protein
MGASFSDITLYAPTPHAVGTPGYIAETSIQHFVSDLYVQKMHGYNPPKTSRITIQPAYHDIWRRTWKNGSIVAIAPYYNYEEFASLDKHGKYKYILDLIQGATLQLSDEYQWDKAIFENAYKEVIESNFEFKIKYPAKTSRDKSKVANLCVEKTEILTSVYVNIETDSSTIKAKLFDKRNVWWYDCAYLLARHGKWHDKNKFGIGYAKHKIDIWYSMENEEVVFLENGDQVLKIDFEKYFLFG